MRDDSLITAPLGVALSLAALAHFFLFLCIYLTDLTSFLDKEKTVPIILISSPNAVQTTNSMSTQENAQAAKEFLQTLESSAFETSKPTTRDTKAVANKSTPSQMNNVRDSKKIKENQKTERAISEFQNIFSKPSNIQSQARKKQISTKEAAKLSDYEMELLLALSNKEKLFDESNTILAKKNISELSHKIELRLFPNGAIKSAQIIQPSGFANIDNLAVKAAYSASPYPTPPKEDIAKRYRYIIPINYQKNDKTN